MVLGEMLLYTINTNLKCFRLPNILDYHVLSRSTILTLTNYLHDK